VGGFRITVGLIAWLVVCGAIAGLIAPRIPNTGFKDSASVLAFVSLSAVAIERGIEGFFAVMASRLGQWWPLAVVRAEFDTFEAETKRVVGPIADEAIKELKAAKALEGKSAEQVKAIDKAIDDLDALQRRLAAQLADATTKLVPGSERLARVGEIGTAMSASLHRAHALSDRATTGAERLLEEAGDVADRASMLIASFTDNPARRITSLVLGAGLGMLVAGGVGINLFIATLGSPLDPNATIPSLLAGALGVALTGVIIGLGSAPTHEVVKSLQAYKDGRAGPIQVATVTTGAGVVPSVVQEGVVLEGFGGAPGGGVPSVAINVRNVRRTS
jgi:hypothetical protein